MTWLGRYEDLLPIRARNAFHILRASTADGPCVLVMAAKETEKEQAQQALRRFADAHAKIDHHLIPKTRRVVEDEQGRSIVELACDAVLDADDAVRIIAEAGIRIPYAVGETNGVMLREALQASSSHGFFAGRFCYGNVLFSADGRMHLIGFGHNVIALRENGVQVPGTVFSTGDVAAGAPPTFMSDFYAMLMMGRSLAAHADLADAVLRVVRGLTSHADLEVVKAVRWWQHQIYVAGPDERASFEECLAYSTLLRDRLGVVVDEEQFRAFFAKVVAAGEEDGGDEANAGPRLEVGPEAAWFSTGGKKTALGARKALRRVLLALVEQRLVNERTNAEKPLSVWQLLAAGWPGEEPVYEAAVNRVYVTVARLRALGVPIERFDDGYRLPPSVDVRKAP